MILTVISKDGIEKFNDVEKWNIDKGVLYVIWYLRDDDVAGKRICTVIPLEQIKRVDMIEVGE